MRIRTRLAIVAGSGIMVAGLATGISAAGHSTSQLPAAKQALEDFATNHRERAARGDKAHDHGRPAPDPDETSPETGLLGAVGAPLLGGVFTPTSAWAGWTTPTTYVQVYAGDSPDDPGNGLVFVVRRSGVNGRLDPTIPPVTTMVRPPAVGGPLRIVRVVGSALVVVNRGGHEMTFKPASATFGSGG